MDAFFEAVFTNSNSISVVSVVLIGAASFIWALSTERLFTGSRGKELIETNKLQAATISEVNKELREAERDLDRITILYEMSKERNPAWPTSSPERDTK